MVTDEIPEVSRLFVAGFGDAEQQRDIKTFSGVTVHVGNKADIYVLSNLTKAAGITTVDPDNLVDLAAMAPVGMVTLVEKNLGDDNWASTPFTYNVCDDFTFGSLEQQFKLHVAECAPGDTVRVTYITNSDVLTVVNLLTSSNNKVVCYDPLVKMMYVVEMAFSLTAKAKSGYVAADVAKEVKEATAKYLVKINQDGTLYKESEYIAYLHSVVKGLDRVSVPLSITYRVFDSKTKSIVTGELPDYADASIFGVTSLQFTNNTLQFYTSTDMVTVNIN